MTVTQSPLTIVNDLDEACNAHDLENVIALFAEDATVTHTPSPDGVGVYRGHEAIRRWLEPQLPGFHVETYGHELDGDSVQWSGQVTFDLLAQMGQREPVTALNKAVVRDGKIQLFVVTNPSLLSRTTNPIETLQYMALSYSLSRCLHVVADLGVADHVDSSPRTVVDLAASVGTNEVALGRVLRLLAAHGVFEAQGVSISHSPASQLLRSDHPFSMRSFVRLFGQLPMWKVYEDFERSVRSGAPATDEVLPKGLFGYYAGHPDDAAVFDDAMATKARAHIAGIISRYDFSPFGRVADIGGGKGHLLLAILDASPHTEGVLFELPHVIDEASGLASSRLRLQAGDFFRDPLPACDAYLLMEIIHGWSDDDAVAILQTIRKAAPEGATLLVIEQMIPDDRGPAWSKMLDIHMLALLGGRQRTYAEYEKLLSHAGFGLVREIKIPGDLSILEARAR